jgi:hypothetical protein
MGTLTVNYGGASVSTPIRVVAAALGINSYSGNLGVATDAATGALLTFTNSGSPGQNIVLWTSGLGADPADSDTTFANPPHPVATPLQIYIGGVQATILYQGSAGYPGVNQINVTIPQSVPSGCGVSLVAVANGVLSNTVMIPIKAGGGVCVDALTGATGTQFSQGEAKAGLVSIVQTNRPREGEFNAANAAFGKYSGLDAARTGAVPSPGGCVVTQAVLGTPAPSFTGLDPGLITLSGPNGLNVSLAAPFGIKGAYLAALPAGSIPKTGGTFTFKGAGGTDVGSFTSALEFANPLLTWTNQAEAAMVDRSQGLTVTWTGGNPGSYVVIGGTAGANSIVAGFTCLAPVDAGRFTVPSYILLAIPSGSGATELQNYAYSSLSATGIDAGLALGDISIAVTSTYR